jgi:predicted acylesterase/phospholipase RssA
MTKRNLGYSADQLEKDLRQATRSQKNVLLALGLPFSKIEAISFDKAWQLIARHRQEQREKMAAKGYKWEEVRKYA